LCTKLLSLTILRSVASENLPAKVGIPEVELYLLGLTGKHTNTMNEQESYAQRAQTSAYPEDPDFGLWTPGSEA